MTVLPPDRRSSFEGLKQIRSSTDSCDRERALDLWETSERLLTYAPK